MKLPLPILCLILLCWFGSSLQAQVNAPSNRAIADLRSDVDRLDQMVRALRLEVEALTRENNELRRTQYITAAQLNAILKEWEERSERNNAAARQTIVRQVSSEIEGLVKQTQEAIRALSQSMNAQPQVERVTTWQDNYPKTGTNYTVKSGDSLARIARDLGSRVDWIRNANRLAGDTIFPGQELFIPLKD